MERRGIFFHLRADLNLKRLICPRELEVTKIVLFSKTGVVLIHLKIYMLFFSPVFWDLMVEHRGRSWEKLSP